jgi:hypothetical protein
LEVSGYTDHANHAYDRSKRSSDSPESVRDVVLWTGVEYKSHSSTVLENVLLAFEESGTILFSWSMRGVKEIMVLAS